MQIYKHSLSVILVIILIKEYLIKMIIIRLGIATVDNYSGPGI